MVRNFKIDQLRIMEHSISPATILSLPHAIASSIKFEGLSLVRVTDSSLQLQKISGVSITLRTNRPEPEKSMWIFSNATIQGQEATVSSSSPSSSDSDQEGNYHLFGDTQIPTSYYRSCLLSPKFFNVINRSIAKICHDSSFDLKLRIKVMVFLKHMIKRDHDFCQLILNELDIKSFIEANILDQTQQTIQHSSDFLQCFQGEKEFAPSLF